MTTVCFSAVNRFSSVFMVKSKNFRGIKISVDQQIEFSKLFRDAKLKTGEFSASLL